MNSVVFDVLFVRDYGRGILKRESSISCGLSVDLNGGLLVEQAVINT